MSTLNFKSGAEMLDALNQMDLYSQELEMYIFLYNEAGGIACYYIGLEEAKELERKAREAGDYWSAFLGVGGKIYDDINDKENQPNPGCSNIDLCNQYYQYKWIDTNDVMTLAGK